MQTKIPVLLVQVHAAVHKCAQGVHVSYDLFYPVLEGSLIRLYHKRNTKLLCVKSLKTILLLLTCTGTSLTSDRSLVSVLCSMIP